MPRGRKSNVVVVQQIEELLREMIVTHFDARFDVIEKGLLPRVDRLESDVREHTGQIRELYSTAAADRAHVEDLRTRLDKLEKKSS